MVTCGYRRPVAILSNLSLRSFTRRGLSLLEVLISILVTAVGLLGLAALLPAGHIQMQRAARTDHAVALGKSVLKELRFRGLLNPFRWTDPLTATGERIYVDPDTANRNVVPTVNGIANGYLRDANGNPVIGFVLDPLGLANARRILHGPPAQPGPLFNRFPQTNTKLIEPLVPVMHRFSIAAPLRKTPKLTDPPTEVELWQAEAERLCRQEDDQALITAQEADPNASQEDPPVQVFDDISVGGRRAVKGSLSWMVTLVREPLQNSLGLEVSAWDRDPNQFLASVVVMHDRLDQDPNILLGAGQFFGAEVHVGARTTQQTGLPASPTDPPLSPGMIPGIGGGTVILGVDTTAGAAPADAQRRMLARLRAGNWIMLARVHPTTPALGGFARWYRIVHADPMEEDEANFRLVRLHGPEWPPEGTVGVNPTTVRDFAILVDNVVGVYEEVIELPHTLDLTPRF